MLAAWNPILDISAHFGGCYEKGEIGKVQKLQNVKQTSGPCQKCVYLEIHAVFSKH